MDIEKRIAELLEMRANGGLTPTELKELGELQEELKEKTSNNINLTKEQLKNVVDSSIEAKTKELAEKITELEKSNSKMVHAGAVEYRSPEQGRQPQIKTERKELIGKALGDYILGRESKALSELTDSAGNILIPTEFRDNVIWYAGLYGLARRECAITPMISRDQQIDAVANEPVGYWVGEDDASTESTATFKDMKLVAKELAVLVTATKKFVNDLKDSRGINVFEMLSKMFGKTMAKQEDDQYLNGDGTVFTGLFGHAEIPVVVMDSGKTSFSDVTYNDLISLTRAIPVEHKKGVTPTFKMHQDIIAIIEKIKDGQNRPIFERGFRDGESDRLLGFKVELTDIAPAIANDGAGVKFIAFGAGSHCSFGDRESMDVEVYNSGTVGGVNLIEKRRLGIQGTEQVAITVHNPAGFATLQTSAT